jgi:hypothetical protein
MLDEDASKLVVVSVVGRIEPPSVLDGGSIGLSRHAAVDAAEEQPLGHHPEPAESTGSASSTQSAVGKFPWPRVARGASETTNPRATFPQQRSRRCGEGARVVWARERRDCRRHRVGRRRRAGVAPQVSLCQASAADLSEGLARTPQSGQRDAAGPVPASRSAPEPLSRFRARTQSSLA